MNEEKAKSSRIVEKFLEIIEKVGNKLPHPTTLFALFALAVIILSGIVSLFNFSVVHPGTGEEIKPVSLLSVDGLHRIIENLITNFTSFAPLGTVLVSLLGIAVAEHSGLIGTILRLLVLKAPKKLLTFVIVFAGILSNTASEIGYVLLVPLAAIIFLAVGRHPIAGLAAAFAGVSGGYSANLLLGTLDPLLAGLSQEAARIINPAYEVNAAANYYFMFVSTFFIAAAGTWVTEKIVIPRLGSFKGTVEAEEIKPLNKDEKRGLWYSGIASKTIKNDNDAIKGMNKSMETLGSYIVLVFFAAQFVAFFNWTNLGMIVAVEGAVFLKSSGLGPIPLLISFIIISAIINLFMGSASAKWAVMAPVFIPMFMLLGYSPELVQAAYRVGDSTTNIIAPMMSYFALVIAFIHKYDKQAGIGTLIATMIPYTITFFIIWSILFIVWFLLGIPVGPGAPMFINK
ncbi:MAG: AbgT family transporter [Ignavibacteriaceae bacterium]